MSRYTDMFEIEVESRTWTRWRVCVKGHSRAARVLAGEDGHE